MRPGAQSPNAYSAASTGTPRELHWIDHSRVPPRSPFGQGTETNSGAGFVLCRRSGGHRGVPGPSTRIGLIGARCSQPGVGHAPSPSDSTKERCGNPVCGPGREVQLLRAVSRLSLRTQLALVSTLPVVEANPVAEWCTRKCGSLTRRQRQSRQELCGLRKWVTNHGVNYQRGRVPVVTGTTYLDDECSDPDPLARYRRFWTRRASACVLFEDSGP
jgi:hypothetical protein